MRVRGLNSKTIVMRKRIFLHIGPHKTGTTSIQATLRFNSEYLETCGVCYLPVGLGPTPDRIHGQHNLAYEICGDYRFDPDGATWSEAMRFIDESHYRTFIISSEAFSTCDVGMVRRLADLLAPYDAMVIYMPRNHVNVINSIFGQNAAKWNTRNTSDWFRRLIKSMTFLHAPKVAPWVETFGPAALRFPVFELEKANLAAGILRITGCEFDPSMIEQRRMNAARRGAHIAVNLAICRALNGLITPAFYNMALAPKLTLVAEGLPSTCEKNFYVPADLIAALEQPIREDVARLRSYGAVLPPDSYDNLRMESPSEVEELTPEIGTMLAAMLLKAQREILAARVARLPKAKHGSLGAPLQRKVDVIDAALSSLGSAKPHGKSGSQTARG